MRDGAEKIIEIIKSNFPNGLRDDFIDTNKVLRLYSANSPKVKFSRNNIAEIIRANGIEDGGKFYFISGDDLKKIRRLFDELLEKYSVVYYSAVYECYTDFFSHVHIFSPEVLKKLLQKFDTTHFYCADFCSVTGIIRLEYEVSKIFTRADISLSLENLKSAFPFVPIEKILEILSDTKKYLPTSTGKYIPLSKVRFDMEEIIATKQQITSCINKNGFSILDDYDFFSNCAYNSEIDKKTLCRLIYEKFLSSHFTKRGKKLFPKNDICKTRNSRGAMSILRKFIADKNELRVDELFSFVENLNLDAYVVSLSVAYEKMIRVGKNLFVKDSLIKFDVDGIDEALTPFVLGKVIPLRAITSFTGFPPVEGYSWNLFLLESFLRKYSRKYVYDTPAPNSASMGAIYPKSKYFKDYLDVQASVVVQENIPLEKSAIGNFLVKQGYRANRLDKTTFRIMERARKIKFI